jgi:protein CpxP
MNKVLGVTLISAALAASSGAALAQGQAPGTSPRAGQHAHEQRAFSRPTERVEARLAYIRTALKITPAQQAQWDAFASSTRQQAAQRETRMQEMRAKMADMRKQNPGMQGQRGMHERPRLSAIERMEREQKRHADAIARLNGRMAVVKPLYASLSPEQQKVADVVLVPQRGERRGHRGGHGAMRGRA